MDFSKNIHLNICMVGMTRDKNVNDRIDLTSNLMLSHTFRTCYENKCFKLYFFFSFMTPDIKRISIKEGYYNDFLDKFFQPTYGEWVREEKEWDIYRKNIENCIQKIIDELSNQEIDGLKRKNIYL